MRAQLSTLIHLCMILGFLASGRAAALDFSLVAWWRFDEGSGTVAGNAAGQANNGTVVGADWVEGGWNGTGHCLEFIYGEGDRVAIDNNMDVVGSGITISAWVDPYSFTQNDARIISKSSTGATADGHWWMVSTNGGVNVRFRLKTDESNTTLTLVDTAGVLVTDEWQFITAMWDGVDATTYVNAVETGRAAKSGTAVATDPSVPVAIGNQPASAGDGERAWDGLIDDVRIYNRALTADELAEVMAGGGPGTFSELATAPVPADEATDVPRDVVLGWTAGEFAVGHDVYLGTALENVLGADRENTFGVLVSQEQTATTYDPETLLDFGTTYYWRVDEVNAAPDHAMFRGRIWRFTTEPIGYPITDVVATSNGISETQGGPENTVNGSGLNDNDEHSIALEDMWLATPDGADPLWIEFEFDRVYRLHEMWVWNYNVQFEPVIGFGLKDVTVEYSTDGVEWVSLGDVEFARATAQADYQHNTTVDFGGISAKFVRLTVGSGHGMLGQYGLSEVRFLYIPVQAREPQPVDGAANVEPDATLSWRPGRDAAVHDVYLGTDPETLERLDSTDQSAVTPADLSYGRTYYWRVDEVNEAEAVPVWTGEVWNFSTTEFVLIDGFETYTDDIDAKETIFDTWIDGWTNDNGSTVGYFDAPFAERTIVHSGAQSMPLAYDNSASPFYSEAQRDLGGMDWDVHGADTLRLFVYGQAPGFAEMADGTIVMNGIGTDIWGTADQFRYAHKNLSGDGSMVVRVDSLVDSDVWAKAGVMIRETLEPGSAFAAVYLSADNGVRYQARLETDASAVSDSAVASSEQIALREPVWVKIERVGDTFNGYYSTDGSNWTAMAWNPQTIAMANDVTIGLALTSHNASVSTGTTFADIASTGGVTGNWQVAEIGVAQPTEGNAPESLYVAIEDGAGRVATVTNPDLAIRSGWNEWQIPFSDLAGVDLGDVQMMYIGLGDQDNPSMGGTGLVFIDDIAYGHPAQ